MTLLELVIVMTIISVLAAVAYPEYAQYTREMRRSDAQRALSELVARLEQYRLHQQNRSVDK